MISNILRSNHASSQYAVDRNGQQKHSAAIASDGFL